VKLRTFTLDTRVFAALTARRELDKHLVITPRCERSEHAGQGVVTNKQVGLLHFPQ